MPGDNHRFAWDGVSFNLPVDWNLARYRYHGKVTRIEFEDDYNQRAIVEWTWPKRDLHQERIEKRFRKREKRLAANVKKKKELTELPRGWKATLYDYGDGNRLVVAYGIHRDPSLFLFMRLYFTPHDHDSPQRLTRQIAQSSRAQDRGTVPWSVYDMYLWLPAQFRLAGTSFEAGRKMMIFQHRLQRLSVWQFSIAHILFKKIEPPAWVVSFLNAQKHLRGPIFHLDETTGRVYAKRSKKHFLGHFEEFGRLCFRYQVGYHFDKDNDRFILWVYNYRRKKALQQLQKGFPLQPGN